MFLKLFFVNHVDTIFFLGIKDYKFNIKVPTQEVFKKLKKQFYQINHIFFSISAEFEIFDE